MSLLIRQARVLDTQQNLDQVLDVYIADGQIAAMGEQLSQEAEHTLNAEGKILVPGMTDLLGYLRQPGNSQKGTIESETKAAASAGFTTILPSPDTNPTTDTTAVLELVQDRAEAAGYCDVACVAALTQGLEGSHLTNLMGLSKAGAIAFSNAGQDITSNTVLLRSYEYAATFGVKIFIQAQDAALATGHMHEGALATRLGLNGIPVIAETLSISRHLQFIEHTGVSAHFQQISSAKGVELIRDAKTRGLDITADVDLAHLCYTEEQVQGYASQYHVQPPLRSEDDRQALLAGVADGTLDAIVSAHQPHEAAAKCAPFADTATGMAMYDTFMPLLLSLEGQGGLTLSQLIDAVTTGATEAADLDSPIIEEGAPAYLCLIDPDMEWQLNEETQQSPAANQSLANTTLKGRTVLTLRGGTVTWIN
jgi:dihydroorotase